MRTSKKASKKASKSSAKKVTKVATPVAATKVVGKVNVLKTICAKVGIDPKTARRILRARMRSTVPTIGKVHSIGNRWVLDTNGAKLVESTLRDYLQVAKAA
jgi:hypothetical protein